MTSIAGGTDRHGRRMLLLAGLASAAGPARATVTLPDSAVLLVPGPEDAPETLWLARLAIGLGRHMPQAMPVWLQVVGGPDGVTAANRFATASAPDGRSLLALTGAAAQARLVGDARAKFDPAGWLPIGAALRPAMLLGRRDALLQALTGSSERPLHLASAGPEAPETALLLVLERAGITAAPIFGLSGAAAEAAFANGTVDAFLGTGADLTERARALDAEPWLSLGSLTGADAGVTGHPALHQAIAGTPAPLADGLRAALAAARIGATLVMPSLTPADFLAAWRHAAHRWQEEEAPREAAASAPLRQASAADAAQALALLCPSAEAVRAYRDWLARRLEWRAT